MSVRSSTSYQAGRPVVGVEDLAPGMVLAENVNDAQGRLLVPQGTELTDRHLRAFQLWGILGVRVRGPEGEEPPAPPISPECLAEAEARVRARFCTSPLAHPVLAELLRICTLREAGRLARGEADGD